MRARDSHFLRLPEQAEAEYADVLDRDRCNDEERKER